MPALVPFISHFGPKIQRSLSFFPSLRSYFSSSFCSRRSGGGPIGTGSSGTAGPSLPGTDKKSNRQSWGNKIKAKSDYLELTELSSNTITVTDDYEGNDGRVLIKDLESGLQRTKVPAQDVDSRLQWSPVAVRHPDIVESQSPSKHIERGLQWSPVSVRHHPDIESLPATTSRRLQSQSPSHHVDSGSQWSPVPPRLHSEIEPQYEPVTTDHRPHSPIKHLDSPLRMHPPR